MRSRVSVLGLVVSVVCVGGVVWWASKQEAPELPSSPADLLTFVAAIALYGVNTMMRAERWHALLRHDGAKPHRADSHALTVIGYTGNNVLPARAGDAVRVMLMAPRAETSRRTVLGTLLAERLLDILVVVLLFLIVGYGVLNEVGAGDLQIVGLVTLVVAIGVAVGLFVLRRSPRLQDFARPMLSSTLNLLRSKHGVEMLILTIGIWACETIVWMVVGAAVNFEMSFLQGLYLVALASVFALIPSGPAYAGTQDSAVVIGIRAIGGTASQALSFLLILRFALVVPITVLGFVLLAARYGGVSKLRRVRLDAATADA